MRYKCWQCCWKSFFWEFVPGRVAAREGGSETAPLSWWGRALLPAAAHRQGIMWDQQEHQMCINFKCTINDTLFPWIRHIGCDAQSQGNVLSKAGAAQAALTWVSSGLCPCLSTLLLSGPLWGSQVTPNVLFAIGIACQGALLPAGPGEAQ